MSRFLILSMVLACAGCGGGFKADLYPTPDELATAAIAAAQSGDCSAVPALRRLVFELPPRDARMAEVRYYLADCSGKAGEHLEASRQFRRVADDFPAHPLAGTAIVRSGDELTELWRRPELDPTYGEQAMTAYREALRRFPTGETAQLANSGVQRLSNWMAEKDFKTGQYYRRLKAYDSAIIYFESVVANYQRSDWVARALVELALVYGRIGYADEQREACQTLRQFYAETDGIGDVCPVAS